MERKTIMGLAAVAGVGLILWMRKSAADQETAGAAGVMGSAVGAMGSGWAGMPITINTTKPLTVSDTAARNTAPAAVTVARPGAAAAVGSPFVAGPAGGAAGPGSKYSYRTQGYNGVITGSVNDAAEEAKLDVIAGFLQGIDVGDPAQVQALYERGRATGRSYDETNRDIAAASGYVDNDVARVAANAGVARW